MSSKTHLLVVIIIVSLFLLTCFSPSHVNAYSASNTGSTKQPSNQTSNVTKVYYNATGSNSTESLNLTSNSPAVNISRFLYLPNTNLKVSEMDGIVQPFYSNSPAPMGIGDFGLINSSGKLTGENYNTSGFSGNISFNNLSAFYLSNDAPNSISIQLNTVLENVTLFGHSNYSFWIQSVALLSVRTDTITLVTNIWNFSSSQATVNSSSIKTIKGKIYPYSEAYIALGPTINITFPFSLRLYQLSTVSDGNNQINFNFSLTDANGTTSQDYNTIQFLSSAVQHSNYAAKQANFTVSGTQRAPNGLLYDSEFVIGGPGGGSTTSVYGINASMNLTYLDSQGSYVKVPSAYDFGANTGETVEGISECYSPANTVKISAGPSLLYGLWNTTANQNFASVNAGYEHYSGVVSPSNGFLFVNTGKNFSQSESSWAPLSTSGAFSFYLPPGNYSAIEMMSFYEPETFELGNPVPTMAKNTALGIYTPLYAWDNSQLSNISYSGHGSVSSPYLLYTSDNATSINPMFGEMNDFTFPVFSGISLKNITEHTVISNPPSFKVVYPSSYYGELTALGLPTSNSLMIQIFGGSNITVENGSYITGWFSSILTGFPLANLILWNSTNDVVSNNYFASMGSSMLVYNDNSTYSNITITSNYYQVDDSTNNFFSNQFMYGSEYYGLEIYSSNNTIYNNYLATSLPAYSPSYDIYTGLNVTYENNWNVSEISGENIIGGNQISGNYWMNYNGVKPFTDYGKISGRGDYSPLTYTQKMSFNTVNITMGTPWEIVVYKYMQFNDAPSIIAGLELSYGPTSFTLPNGTYYYAALAEGDYYEIQGTFSLNGQDNSLQLAFESYHTYNVSFETSGLGNNTMWIVTFGGVTAYTNASEVIYVGVPNGTYNYSVSTNLYNATPSSGLITVRGVSEHMVIQFTSKLYTVEFVESGLPSGTEWSVVFGGVQGQSSGNALVFTNVPIGSYNYSFPGVSGYSNSPGGSVYVNGTDQVVYVSFSTGSVTSGVGTESVAYLLVGVAIGISLAIVWRKIKGS